MKKLLVAVVIISILNLIILVLMYGRCPLGEDVFGYVNKCDTVINKVRIDSIEYIIRSKDSIINKIKYEEKEYNKKIDALDDDANVKLFKELVSK